MYVENGSDTLGRALKSYGGSARAICKLDLSERAWSRPGGFELTRDCRNDAALVKVFAVILNAAFLDQGIGHEYKVPGPSGGEFQLREIRS